MNKKPVLQLERLLAHDPNDTDSFGNPKGPGHYADRTRIPGGWLVFRNAVTFVPDPNHEWDGGSLP